jgi:RNA polymerase sigma-70 factor (ECF subfamily)
MTIEKLLEAHLASLKNYALILTRNQQDADDLVSMTVEKILKKKDLYKEQDKFAQWSHRTMKNTFIDNWRKKVRQDIKVKVSSIEYNKGAEVVNSWAFGVIDNTAESDLQIEAINDCISELDEEYKQIVIMKIEGYTFKEMQKMLGKNYVYLRSRHVKAITILRQKIRERLGLD